MTKIYKTTSLIIVALILSVSAHAQQVIQNRTYESGEQEQRNTTSSISTADTVTVKPAAKVDWESAVKIHLTPGFHALQGANYHALVPDENAFVLFALDGDNQSASPGAVNARPFEIAAWQNKAPVVNMPVTFSVQSGGGSLMSSPDGAGGSSLTLMSDIDGTVRAYYKQPTAANVTSTIRVAANGKTLQLLSYNFATPLAFGNENGTGGNGNGNGNTGSGGNAPGNTNGNAPDWTKGKEGDNAAGFAVYSPEGDSVATTATGPAAPSYVTSGLIQHFDADNNTGSGHSATATMWTDLSGKGNHGTLQNYATAAWQANYLPFNGNNQYVSTPLNLSTLNMSFTVHVIAVMQNSSNYRGIFGGHNSQPGVVGGQWDNGQCFFGVATSTQRIGTFLTSTQAPANIVTCYDLVIENGMLGAIYKNGTLIAALAVTGAPLTQLNSAETMTLGRAYNAAGRYLLGNIYSFMVYNRTLTATEIAQNYAYEKARLGLP